MRAKFIPGGGVGRIEAVQHVAHPDLILIERDAAAVGKDAAIGLVAVREGESVAREIALEFLVDRRSEKEVLVGRVKIVDEARERDLTAGDGAADLRVALEHQNL